ncbi:hypothetical protein AMJ57_05700 [Parcubacteria bacterium SG8_24]|nr:MAG: hypothetical protein AMJ57_05700 [Parcubacteria bacterium SG8_24]
MPKLVDTHAHLDASIYERDLDIVVRRALQEGIWIVTVGTDYASSRRAVEIARRYPEGVFAAVGLHPLRVGTRDMADDKLLDLEKFQELASDPKVVALGDVGLDYHDLPAPVGRGDRPDLAERIRTNQKKVLSRFLELSRELRLPLLLHCREAHQEMLEILETWDRTSRGFDSRGIVHHFSGTWKEARRYFNLDFLISFTGLVAHGGYRLDVIRKTPPNRLVVESECPHLTPNPWSIRRNEPSYLGHAVERLATARGVKPDELAVQTTKNALRTLRKLNR